VTGLGESHVGFENLSSVYRLEYSAVQSFRNKPKKPQKYGKLFQEFCVAAQRQNHFFVKKNALIRIARNL
jgi:hypothetical protein